RPLYVKTAECELSLTPRRFAIGLFAEAGQRRLAGFGEARERAGAGADGGTKTNVPLVVAVSERGEGVVSPVRVIEHFTAEQHGVGVAVRGELLSLLRVGDEADRRRRHVCARAHGTAEVGVERKATAHAGVHRAIRRDAA